MSLKCWVNSNWTSSVSSSSALTSSCSSPSSARPSSLTLDDAVDLSRSADDNLGLQIRAGAGLLLLVFRLLIAVVVIVERRRFRLVLCWRLPPLFTTSPTALIDLFRWRFRCRCRPDGEWPFLGVDVDVVVGE